MQKVHKIKTFSSQKKSEKVEVSKTYESPFSTYLIKALSLRDTTCEDGYVILKVKIILRVRVPVRVSHMFAKSWK